MGFLEKLREFLTFIYSRLYKSKWDILACFVYFVYYLFISDERVEMEREWMFRRATLECKINNLQQREIYLLE